MTTDESIMITIEEIIHSLNNIVNNNDRKTICAIQPDLDSYKELLEAIAYIG